MLEKEREKKVYLNFKNLEWIFFKLLNKDGGRVKELNIMIFVLFCLGVLVFMEYAYFFYDIFVKVIVLIFKVKEERVYIFEIVVIFKLKGRENFFFIV